VLFRSLDLIDKLKQIDSDRMYLSSSSNDCLETSGHQLSDVANHDDAHHDQHQSSSQATNSLTSSSSSSCSLFEGTTNPSSSQSNAEHLSDVNKEEGNTIDEEINKTPDAAPTKFQSFFKLNETNRFASDIESALHNLQSGYSASPASSTAGLKKPITFASIAAAAHSGTPTALPLNTQHVSPGFQAKFGSPSNSKIESILNEFKQNIYLLQLALNQASKNFEDYAKLQQMSPTQLAANPSIMSSHNHQLQVIQAFNSNVHSIYKQMNASLANTSKQLNFHLSSAASTINSDLKNLEADLEIA